MKMGELSARTGLPVGTIKFYIRAGLITPGAARARNQADYDEHHVRRLRLIRALADVGGLSLSTITEVLAAVDDQDLPLHDAFGLAQDSMVEVNAERSADWIEAEAVVAALVERLGWQVRPEARARDLVTSAVVTLRRFGWGIDEDFLDGLAGWVGTNAELEVGYLDPDDRAGAMEISVIGTVGVEQALNGLRRMALEHHSARRFNHGRSARVNRRPDPRSPAPDPAAAAPAPRSAPRSRRPRTR